MTTKITPPAQRIDIYKEVTSQIIAMLEGGTRPWSPSWASGGAALPMRYEGTSYRGINIILLWCAAMARGFTNPHWMTYRQAQQLGGQVRKDEKGQVVVHAGTFTPKDEDSEPAHEGDEAENRTRTYLKRYVVFNVEQIDGLDFSRFPTPDALSVNPEGRVSGLDEAFACYPVPYNEGGTRAYYNSESDRIQVPPFADFSSSNAFYSTLAHEALHSTGHTSRLNRETLADYTKSLEIRAMEEMIAEIGAAMVCASLGMEPTEREDHASYVAAWLTVLRGDKRAVFRAASAAQEASDYLLAHMGQPIRQAA